MQEQIIQTNDVQIMLDLETMGTRTATAPIISLGAVAFSIDEGIIETFKVNISLQEQVTKYGKIPEPDTIAWWEKQGEDVLKRSMSHAKPVSVALESFNAWFKTANPKFVWANGIDFDFPKLQELYLSLGNDNGLPWKYWQQNDYRTVLTVFGYDNRKVRAMQEKNSDAVYHDAMSDAKGQAEFLIEILKALYA